jgi:hypothetical protein
LKKKEAILAELANKNYEIASIAEKTNTRPKRVIAIIYNQGLRGNVEGWMNEANTHFVPGSVLDLYMPEIQGAKNRLIVGIIVFVISLVELILFVSRLFYAPFIAHGMLIVLLVMSVIFIYTKSTRLGTPAYTRNRLSLALIVSATIITYTQNIIMYILVAIFLSKQLT